MPSVLVVGPPSLSDALAGTCLWREGIQRLHASSAADVRGLLSAHRPALTVIDGSDAEAALALISTLRGDPGLPPTAIAVLTKKANGAEQRLRVAGANAIIVHPVDAFAWDGRLLELLEVPPRREESIPVLVDGWSNVFNGAGGIHGTILNVGVRGALLECSMPLDLGTKLGLVFQLPGDQREMRVVGQVARQAGQANGRLRSGIEFIVVPGAARRRIEHFAAGANGVESGPAVESTQTAIEDAALWEEELRASELRKSTILDSAVDCIVTVDLEGRIVEFNAAARRAFGYSRAEVFGREVAEKIVPPAMRDDLRHRLRRFLLDGESVDFGRRVETVAMRADGSDFPVELTVVPTFVKGRILLTAFIRDLSEKKRAERLAGTRNVATRIVAESASLWEALPRLLETLAARLGFVRSALWVSGGDPVHWREVGTWPVPPTVEETNAAALVEEAHRSGKSWWVVTGRPAVMRVAIPFSGSGRNDCAFVMERPGAIAPERDLLVTLEEIASLVGLSLERQQSEDALRENEVRITRIADGVPGAVFQYRVSPDATEGFTFLSRGARDVLGLSPEECLVDARLAWGRVLPEEIGGVKASLFESAEERHPWIREFRVRDGQGRGKWVRAQALPETLGDGTRLWNGLLVDINQQKAAEAALQRLNRDLDGRLTEIRRAEVKAERLARFDATTGLGNRGHLMETLASALPRAERQRSHVALVSMEVDGIRRVDESLGPPAGDVLLQVVAERLRRTTRRTDVVARLGGDEFAIVVQDLHRPEAAAVVAQWLVEQIGAPIPIAGTTVCVSARIGIGVFPGDGIDAEALLRAADAALHRAKLEGPASYRFFTASLDELVQQRSTLQAGLRQALERGELALHYQPILHRGRPPSLEALLRWHHPERGILSPEHFIGLAEESGLIVPMDSWVVGEACGLAQSFGATGPRVSVNISARQFRQPDFVEIVERRLRDSGLAPDRLELELTESALLTDVDESASTLLRLREMGVRLALDDFGTGYSSLSHLTRLRFDSLKLDRAFVSDLPGDPRAVSMAEAVLAMASSLGMEVVAEGVENEDQRAFLEARGCTSYQGFLLSAALPPGQAIGWIRSRA